MNAREIVVQEIQRVGRDVVLQLLAEPVREARVSAHAHPHRQVLTLGERRRNVSLGGAYRAF
jgi:hypothetical protein